MSRKLGWRWIVAGGVVLGLLIGVPLFAGRVRLAYKVALARSSLDASRCDDARRLLEQAERIDPLSAKVQYWLAVACRRSGHLADVEEHLQRATRLGWLGEDIKRQRALTAYQACDYANSEPYLRKLITDGAPNDVALEIYEALVKGAMSGYMVGNALYYLDHWIAWRPDDLQPYFIRAAIWDTLDEHEKEKADLTQVLRVDPEHIEGRYRYGECLMQFSRASDALEHFRWCHEREPDNLDYTITLANCYLRLGQNSLARALLGERLPDGADDDVKGYALSMLGQLDFDERDYQTAAERLTQAVRFAPNLSQAHYTLGRALSRLGRRQEAEQCFARSTEMTDVVRRLDELAHQIMNEPRNADLRIDAGTLLVERGSLEDALPVLLSVIQREPQNVAAHQLLTKLYEQQGRHDMAAKHRRAAEHPETVRHKSLMATELSIADN